MRVKAVQFAVVWCVCSLLLLGSVNLLAQEAMNEKASRYHSVLVKRPTPGYLFDRFYNAWLDTASLESLEDWLEAEVARNESTENRLILAFFHAKQGENVRALEEFRKALAKNPGSAETWYQKALVEARTLDFETALEDLRNADEAGPDDEMKILILQMEGRLLARNGETERAMEVWKRLLEDHPNDEELQEDLIELQISEGLFDQAIETSEALVASTGDIYKNVLRELRIGDIHQRVGKRADALETYAACLEKVGADSWLEKEIFSQIEQVFRREDDINGLKAYYAALVEKYPQRIGLRQNHAKLLAENGENEEAIAAFAEILPLTPGDRAVREAYIDLLVQLEELTKAATQLERLIEQHPDDPELFVKLAGLQFEAENPEATQTALKNYLERSDQSEYAFLRAARLMERYGLAEATETLYQRLEEQFPDSQAVREAYAVYLHERDQKEEAIAIWQELASGADRSEVVRIARTLSRQNEHVAAFDLLQERYEAFKGDGIYLSQLCQSALQLEKHAEAIPWSMDLVRTASNVLDLENAITLAVKIILGADRSAETIRELEDRVRTPQESCLLAELHEMDGNSIKADGVLSALGDDESELVVGQQVRLFRQRNEWTQAAEAVERLIGLPGGRKSTNVQTLVDLYSRGGDIESALQWIPEWKKLSPGSTLPWITEARMLQDEGRTQDATEVLRLATQQFEGNEDIRATLAELYSSEGKIADAQRIYLQMYEEAPDLKGKLQWVRLLAESAEALGKSNELLEQFEERRRSNRTSLIPLLALAEIHRVNGDYEERRQAMLEAIRLKPDDLELLLAVASIEEAEGDITRAMATLEKAAALDTTTRTQERIAELHFYNGNEEEGYRKLYEMAGGDAIDADSVQNLAQAMLVGGDWERVLEFLQPYIEKFPDHYGLRYLDAVAKEEIGQTQEAITAFRRLLQFDGSQLAQAANNVDPMQAYMNQVYGDLEEILPDDTYRLILLNQYAQGAYQHQHARRYGSRFGGSFGTRSVVTIPSDTEMLHGYAVLHLSKLAKFLDEEDVAELKRELEASGFSYASLALDLDVAEYGVQPTEQFIQAHPDNESVIALGLMMQMDQGVLLLDQLRTAYEMFKSKNDQLALVAGIEVGMKGDEDGDQEILEFAINELLPKVTKPTYPCLWVVLKAVGLFGQELGANPLQGESLEMLTDALIEWYPTIEQHGPIQFYLFMSVAAALSSGTDLEPFVSFLDQEVAMQEEKKVDPQLAMMVGMARSSQSSLLNPLTFPPQAIPGFPMSVTMVLSADNPDMGIMFHELDADALKVTLGGVKSPILKVLLAHRAGEEGIVEETLDALIGLEEPVANHYWLAAAFAADQQDFEKAIELLSKCQYLPMDREQRKSVDSALVAWALMTDEAEEGGEVSEARNTGREAALRLRRNPLMTNERQELITAMEDLGLEQEAEKLEAQLSAFPPSSASGASGGYTSGSGSRVQDLINKGDRKQAIRVAVTELKRLAGSAFSPTSTFDSQWEVEQWKELVMSNGLADEVIQELATDEGDSRLRQMHESFALEALEKREKAIEIYRTLLAERSRDDGIRLRLIALLLSKDQKEVEALLAEVSPLHLEGAINSLQQKLFNSTQPLDATLGFVNAIVSVITAKADLDKINLNWMPNLADALANLSYIESVSLRPLYHRYPQDYQDSDDESSRTKAAFEKRIRETHDRLCQTMLEIPSLSREGFRRLAGLDLQDGKDPSELMEMAKAAVLLYEPQRSSTGGMIYFSGHSERISLPNPEEFLVMQAYRSGNEELITQDVLPLVEKKNDPELAGWLKSLRHLYFCSVEDFPKAVEEYLNQRRSGRMGALAHLLGNSGMEQVVTAWTERKSDYDLGSLLLEQMEKSKGQHSGSSDGHLSMFLATLLERSGLGALTEFLDKMTDVYLGPKDRRQDLVSAHYQSNSVSSGTHNASIHQYREILAGFSRDFRLIFPVMNYYRENIAGLFTADRYGSEPQLSNHPLMRSDTYQNVERTMEWLKNVPTLLVAFEDFRIFSDEDSGSFLYFVVRNLKSVEETLRDTYRDLIQKEPESFGRDFLLTIWNKPLEEVVEFLGSHKEEIIALPEWRQKEFAFILEELGDESTKFEESSLSEDALELHGFLGGLGESQINREIEAIMASKKVDDLPFDEWSFDESLTEYAELLLPDRQAELHALFWKVAEVAEQARIARHWQKEPTFYGDALGRCLMLNDDVVTLNFALSVTAKPDDKVHITRIYPNTLGQVFRSLCEDSHGDTPQNRLAKLLQLVGEGVESQYQPLLVDAWQQVFRTILPKDLLDPDKGTEREALLAALEEQLANEPYEQAVREMLFGLELYFLSQSSDEGQEANSHKAWDHYDQLLGDKALSLTSRLGLAESLTSHFVSILNPRIRYHSAILLIEAWDAGVPVLQEQIVNVSRSLIRGYETDGDSDSWKEEVMRFLNSWRANVLKNPVSQRSGDPAALGEVMELALKVGDEPTLTLVVSRQLQQATIEWVDLLMKHDQMAVAQRVLKDRLPVMDWRQNYGDSVRRVYDEELETDLAALLEGIEVEDLRLFTEALFKSMPNAEGFVASTREERLLDIASRFEVADLKNVQIMEAILSFLAEEPKVADVLHEKFEEVGSSIAIAVLRNLGDQVQREQKTRIVAMYLRHSLRKGPSVFREQLTQTLSGQVRNDYQRRSAFSQLIKIFSSSFVGDRHVWSPEVLHENLIFWKEFIPAEGEVPVISSEIGTWTATLIAMQTLANEPDQMAEWISSSEGLRKEMENEHNQNRIYEEVLEMAEFLSKSEGLSSDQKQSLLRAFHNFPAVVAQCNRSGSRNLFLRYIQSGLVDEAVMMDLGPELLQVSPRRGYGGQELATMQERAELNEAALESWDFALETIDADSKGRYTEFHLAKARLLIQMDRKDEAKSLLEQMDTQRLYEGEVDNWRKLGEEVGAELPPIDTEAD